MIDMQHRIRFAVDITFLLDQYSTRGIGRYGKEMVSRLILLAQTESDVIPELHLIGFGSLADNLPLLGFDPVQPLKNVAFTSLGERKLSKPLINLRLYHLHIRPLIAKLHPDFYYAVHFDRGIPSDLTNAVVAIHDAIPLVTGKYSSQGMMMNAFKSVFYKYMWEKLKAAKLIFTASNFSKQDLIEYGKLQESVIHVVYLGIADYFRRQNITKEQKLIDAILGNFDLLDAKSDAQPYMIYDSGLETNKNIPQLLNIFAKIAQRQPELKLVLTGGDFQRTLNGYVAVNERSQQAVDMAEKLGITANLVPTGRISEQELVVLLSEARQYVNLSGYEGFGFGPLQAMAAGVPVIISNRGSFPEIAGTAAIIVDPDQPEKAAAHIIEALSNETAIAEMIKAGFAQAARYNWDDTFTQTWQTIVDLWTHPQKN